MSSTDVGQYFAVIETATVGAATVTVTSNLIGPVAAETPVEPATPAAPTGITWQGQTLTAQTGTWSQ